MRIEIRKLWCVDLVAWTARVVEDYGQGKGLRIYDWSDGSQTVECVVRAFTSWGAKRKARRIYEN